MNQLPSKIVLSGGEAGRGGVSQSYVSQAELGRDSFLR